MSFVYDAGVLVAADRNVREVWADHRARLELGIVPVTTAPAVAQVSRSPRQVQLRRLLRGCDVMPFAAGQAHTVGALLASAEMTDVVDAHIVIVASRAESTILTSDPGDLGQLATHAPNRVRVQAI